MATCSSVLPVDRSKRYVTLFLGFTSCCAVSQSEVSSENYRFRAAFTGLEFSHGSLIVRG